MWGRLQLPGCYSGERRNFLRGGQDRGSSRRSDETRRRVRACRGDRRSCRSPPNAGRRRRPSERPVLNDRATTARHMPRLAPEYAGRRKRRGRSNSSSTRQTVSVIPIRPSPLSRGLQPSPSGSFSRSSAKSHKTGRAIRPKGKFRVPIGPLPSAQLLSGPRSAACPRGRPTKPEQCGARSVSGQTCAHLPADRGTHVTPRVGWPLARDF